MRNVCGGLAARLGVVLVVSLSVAWSADEIMAAPIIHSRPFEAPGDGCIFDLVATGGGVLKVDMKADTAGDRWRTAIVVVDTKTVESNVGTGSATSFTGLVQRTVGNGKRYEVVVAYEHPLSGTIPDPFPPTSVEVRFWGPAVDQNHVTITGPRPQGAGAPAGPPAPVSQTGQTASYAPGDDGDIEAGVSWPTPHFTDNGNGTVADHLTSLIWLQNADCDAIRNTDWGAAVLNADSLASGLCGLTDGSVAGDWRLPNVKELQSLVDFGQSNPALPAGHPFARVRFNGPYWSSTTRADNQALAWYVFLGDGQAVAAGKVGASGPFFVWPVRGGQ